jgi:hypothetical protein
LKPRTAPVGVPTSTGGSKKEDIFGGATLSVEKQKKREEELAAKLKVDRDYAEKKQREERERRDNERSERSERTDKGGWSSNTRSNNRNERRGNNDRCVTVSD